MTMHAARSIVGALFAVAVSTPASAAIREEPVSYKDGDTVMKGFVVYDDATQAKRPGIVVVHEWWGITKHVHDSARSLAAMGYTAFIAEHVWRGQDGRQPQTAGELSEACARTRRSCSRASTRRATRWRGMPPSIPNGSALSGSASGARWRWTWHASARISPASRHSMPG